MGEGGPVTVAAKSRAQGVGMGKRGDRLEGGGDGESTAIKEDSCIIGMRSKALGLLSQTSNPIDKGCGRGKEAGMGVQ